MLDSIPQMGYSRAKSQIHTTW